MGCNIGTGFETEVGAIGSSGVSRVGSGSDSKSSNEDNILRLLHRQSESCVLIVSGDLGLA